MKPYMEYSLFSVPILIRAGTEPDFELRGRKKDHENPTKHIFSITKYGLICPLFFFLVCVFVSQKKKKKRRRADMWNFFFRYFILFFVVVNFGIKYGLICGCLD